MALDFPNSPTNGQSFSAANGVTYVWDATATLWKVSGGPLGAATIADTPPSNPGPGALWWNSTDGRLYTYYNDGSSSQWVPATPIPTGLSTWRQLGRIVTTAAQATVDFTSIPSDINDIELAWGELAPTSGATGVNMQFFDAVGAIVSAGSSYFFTMSYAQSSVATMAAQNHVNSGISNLILLSAGVDVHLTQGCTGWAKFSNIRETARVKKCTFGNGFLNSAATNYYSVSGAGQRQAVGAITGVRLLTGNTFAANGVATLWGSP